MTSATVLAQPELQSPLPYASADTPAGKYLIFRLGEEHFGVPIARVREIIVKQQITAVPHTHAFVRGVINLRGNVIPIVDLRLRLGITQQPNTLRTCIILLRTLLASGERTTGVLVDEALEVAGLAEIEDTLPSGSPLPPSHLLRVATGTRRPRLLLDIDAILATFDTAHPAAS